MTPLAPALDFRERGGVVCGLRGEEAIEVVGRGVHEAIGDAVAAGNRGTNSYAGRNTRVFILR